MTMDTGTTNITDLPAEIRLLIYEQVLQDASVSVECLEDGRITTRSSWALLLVCRLFRRELSPMMPGISCVSFDLLNVNRDSVWRWCHRMGPTRTSQMRRWGMNGEGVCLTGWDETTGRSAQAPNCFRSITLDLDRGFEGSHRDGADQAKHSENTTLGCSPRSWSSLRAVVGGCYCNRGCLGCRYCTQVVAVGQVSKMQWSADGTPLPTLQLLMNLVDTITRNLSECLCPQGCGIEGCNQHRGELIPGASMDPLLQLLRLRDYNERYLVE